jgi:hypothetical protein
MLCSYAVISIVLDSGNSVVKMEMELTDYLKMHQELDRTDHQGLDAISCRKLYYCVFVLRTELESLETIKTQIAHFQWWMPPAERYSSSVNSAQRSRASRFDRL